MFNREYRELSDVPRWAIIRTIQRQNVAEHSYYVTLYAGQVADFIDWTGDRADLLDYALRHDLEEMYMSDIPGPSKRAMMTDRVHYDEHCRAENVKRFGADYVKRLFYPVDETPEGDWRTEEEIKAIIKVADLLDECFFLCLDQQLGNRAVETVFEHSLKRLLQAIVKLPCDTDAQKRLTEVANRAIYAHRNEQSITPTG